MREESNKRNGLVPEPRGTTWPPPWLTSPLASPALAMPARVAALPKLPEPPADVSPWDLTPELYEKWEERVCIMHYDGRLPWREAEALALADVLRQAEPSASKVNDDAAANVGPMPAPTVQATLFTIEKGPYA